MSHFHICAPRLSPSMPLEGRDQSLIILGDAGQGLRISVWERDATLFYTVTEITAVTRPINPAVANSYELGNEILTGHIGGKP